MFNIQEWLTIKAEPIWTKSMEMIHHNSRLFYDFGFSIQGFIRCQFIFQNIIINMSGCVIEALKLHDSALNNNANGAKRLKWLGIITS